jgi:hypothetical protein
LVRTLFWVAAKSAKITVPKQILSEKHPQKISDVKIGSLQLGAASSMIRTVLNNHVKRVL